MKDRLHIDEIMKDIDNITTMTGIKSRTVAKNVAKKYNAEPLHEAHQYILNCIKEERKKQKLAANPMPQQLRKLKMLESGVAWIMDIKLFLSYSKPQTMNPLDKALHAAIASGILENVKDLIKKDANINANIHWFDGDEIRPLHLASKLGHLKMVEYLVHEFGNIDARTKYGNTPLHFAKTPDIADYLLTHYAKIDVANYYFVRTPLLQAIKDCRFDVAFFLINKGANVNVRNRAGVSPLLHAISSLQRLLLESYLEMLLLESYKELITLLVKHGAKINAKYDLNFTFLEARSTVLHLAVFNAICQPSTFYPDIVKDLVKLGADINAKTDDGETPLHIFALGLGNAFKIEIAKLLCTRDNVHATNTKGETVLHKAGTAEAVNYFVEAGANVNARDNSGNTPLHTRVAVDSSVTVKIVQCLIDRGADATALNKNNMSPVEIARINGENSQIYILLKNAAEKQSGEIKEHKQSITAPVGTLFQSKATSPTSETTVLTMGSNL